MLNLIIIFNVFYFRVYDSIFVSKKMRKESTRNINKFINSSRNYFSLVFIKPLGIVRPTTEKRNSVRLISIPKANHYFSTNGKIGKGIAVNGCRYNPIVKMSNGSLKMHDGTAITKRESRKKCLTKESGEGKNRKKLNDAVELTINFFIDNLK